MRVFEWEFTGCSSEVLKADLFSSVKREFPFGFVGDKSMLLMVEDGCFVDGARKLSMSSFRDETKPVHFRERCVVCKRYCHFKTNNLD